MGITTRVRVTDRLPEGDATAAAMVRLVRELARTLDEAGLLAGGDETAVDNVVYAFLKTQTKRVNDEVLHG